jgi:hypothetical protein
MAKIYVAKIEVEYEVDDNNYLHWEDEYEIEDQDKDEDFEARSKTKLINYLKDELTEIITDSMSRDDLWTSITVEERETND